MTIKKTYGASEKVFKIVLNFKAVVIFQVQYIESFTSVLNSLVTASYLGEETVKL